MPYFSRTSVPRVWRSRPGDQCSISTPAFPAFLMPYVIALPYDCVSYSSRFGRFCLRFRRAALFWSEKIVVPWRTLVDLATRNRKPGNAKIAYIPKGGDYEKFARPPVRGAVPGFEKEPGEIGERNQLRVREKYSREEMFRAYETVFEARYA